MDNNDKQQQLGAQIEADVAGTLGGLQLKVIELSRTLELTTSELAAKDERISELEALLDAATKDEEA
ncbi:hypothetical protein KM908_14650 [Alkalihalobacillus clausii]|uniref:hypothetical protein n=1 Tax=Shouchella clausii TaxID=79880 RepID=UPI001653287F|nr:hypothetical protein [Shouchella clausii]MBU8597383.1 hypothetical protein [Shouchella clausii]QNM43763.1 hypothetical protein DUT88_13035 [Shouchella clausii]GIN10227.1 hypothetical protein J26TS2_00940 [Shouchella clausii]